jgi:hypothetical protein
VRRTFQVPAWALAWGGIIVLASLAATIVLILVTAHVADLRCHP